MLLRKLSQQEMYVKRQLMERVGDRSPVSPYGDVRLSCASNDPMAGAILDLYGELLKLDPQGFCLKLEQPDASNAQTQGRISLDVDVRKAVTMGMDRHLMRQPASAAGRS